MLQVGAVIATPKAARTGRSITFFFLYLLDVVMAQHRIEIHPWADIAAEFADSLIVGNGASIAVSPNFAYASLHAAAVEADRLPAPVAHVFERFQTQDFELVLRRLWQATMVNQALELPDGPVEAAYRGVRQALIETVRATHIGYAAALPHLKPIYQFMQRFRTVVSLNYDLLVYWAAMLGNEELGNWFKDGFDGLLFREDWRVLREPHGADGVTLCFYPHGNLALARTRQEREIKIHAADGNLLETVFERWSTGRVAPLYVSEGLAERKRQAISESPYLRAVSAGPMLELGESVAIYGWGLGVQDSHLLDAVAQRPPRRAALSVYRDNQDFAQRAGQLLAAAGIEEVVHFNAESPSCWSQPTVNV